MNEHTLYCATYSGFSCNCGAEQRKAQKQLRVAADQARQALQVVWNTCALPIDVSKLVKDAIQALESA